MRATGLIRPSALRACGDQHGIGVLGVLTRLGLWPNVPAGGGAVRGPGRRTVPDPEQLVNVRGGFGGDNVWICWLGGGNKLWGFG